MNPISKIHVVNGKEYVSVNEMGELGYKVVWCASLCEWNIPVFKNHVSVDLLIPVTLIDESFTKE